MSNSHLKRMHIFRAACLPLHPTSDNKPVLPYHLHWLCYFTWTVLMSYPHLYHSLNRPKLTRRRRRRRRPLPHTTTKGFKLSQGNWPWALWDTTIGYQKAGPHIYWHTTSIACQYHNTCSSTILKVYFCGKQWQSGHSVTILPTKILEGWQWRHPTSLRQKSQSSVGKVVINSVL